MITVLDYGMGNLGSIVNMLKRIGVDSDLASDLESLKNAKKIILPGVGAFDTAMSRIHESGMLDLLHNKALQERIPILGICLGMQLLTRGSEEGEMDGLGWIPAQARRFPDDGSLKVPHMGWNIVSPTSPSKLTADFEEETRFYFVHSYAVNVDEGEHSILKTSYGIDFDSAIQKDNIFGVQFHPEKSHRFGIRLLNNFVAL
tara:strand:+ start:19 stop:624 length:606 start_codon:yes stop_codon:yes gene_type:complete